MVPLAPGVTIEQVKGGTRPSGSVQLSENGALVVSSFVVTETPAHVGGSGTQVTLIPTTPEPDKGGAPLSVPVYMNESLPQ